MTEAQPPSRIQELSPRPVWRLILAAGWFALAGAMALWPRAVGGVDFSCAADDEAGVICFIFERWGTPLGIGFSVVFGLITLWGYLKPGDTTATDQALTAGSKSAVPSGESGAPPKPRGALAILGKVIAIVYIAFILFLVCGTAWLVAWVFGYRYFE